MTERVRTGDNGAGRPHISVVVPVYKAKACLGELYARLVASLEPITANFEIVLVEDCGGDGSWEIIGGLAAADRRVRGFQLSRNFGQHYGITAGIDNGRGDWVVVMDCDLQDRPEEIPNLYAAALQGYDIVVARRGHRADNTLRRAGSWVFTRLFKYLSGMSYDGQVGTFRIISRRVADNFGLLREQLRFFPGLIEWLGFSTASIDVRHAPRFEGTSAYTMRTLSRFAGDAIIAFSDKPLRIAVKLGFTMSIGSFLYGGYILYRAFFHGTPIIGWSSLICSLYLIGGIIVAMLGIIGIYLGKTFDECKNRPLYIIGRTTGDERIRLGGNDCRRGSRSTI